MRSWHPTAMCGIFRRASSESTWTMTMSQNILPSAEKEIFLQDFVKKRRRQTKYISQLTRTVREKQFPGIFPKHWDWTAKRCTGLRSMRLRRPQSENPSRMHGKSIWIWWMRSRRDVWWIVWWVIGSVRFCGRK